MTIESAFEVYWENLLKREPRLGQFPKSYRAQMKDAFVEGYKVGNADRETEREAHKGIAGLNAVLGKWERKE